MSEMNDLEKFLRERKQTEEQEKISWETRREDYLKALDTLFVQIKEWLQPLVDQGLITFASSQTLLNEMHVGRYHAQVLIAQSGGQPVHFEPVGTEIIGAYGRVDIKGHKQVTLLWVPKSANRRRVTVLDAPGPSGRIQTESASPGLRVWKIATPPPNITFADFTSKSLSGVLMDVIRG